MGNLQVNSSDLSIIYNDFQPAVKNLYCVSIFTYPSYYGSRSINSADESTFKESSISEIAKLHATSITFDGETLNLERSKSTKKFHINSSNAYALNDTLKIVWREDDKWSVKRFHEDWLKHFYDRETDKFISSSFTGYYEASQATKNAQNISKYAGYMSWNGKVLLFKVSFSPDSTGNPQKIIRFNGVLPKNMSNFDFKWGKSPDIVTHNMEYYVESWSWEKE